MSRQQVVPIIVCLSCVLSALFTTPACATSLDDEELLDPSFLHIGSGLACELAKCLKGQCVNSTSFPFYKCECNAGWQSPFGASWLPCILPNCSIDFTCANTSAAGAAPAPSPPAPSFSGGLDVCSLHVCGNGQCLQNASSSTSSTEDDYECACDQGYVNFGNKADGYCIRKCSIGADCTNVRLPLPSPPPPAVSSPSSTSSSSPSANQGQIRIFGNRLPAVTALIMIIMWR